MRTLCRNLPDSQLLLQASSGLLACAHADARQCLLYLGDLIRRGQQQVFQLEITVYNIPAGQACRTYRQHKLVLAPLHLLSHL
jgi:hypothetical protein